MREVKSQNLNFFHQPCIHISERSSMLKSEMTMTKFLQIASSTDRFGELDGDGGERRRGADNFTSDYSTM